MAEFDAIDVLLAAARQEVPLPPAEERRRLREELNLSRAQLAQALGVSASTVGGWESGREPGGEVREKYAYFLDGARARLDAASAAAGAEALADAPAPAPADDKPAEAERTAGVDDADVDVLRSPQPCVLCGQSARDQVEGFPQHLDPAECGTAAPIPAQPEKPAPRTAARPPAPDRKPGRAASGVKVVQVGRRIQAASRPPRTSSAPRWRPRSPSTLATSNQRPRPW
ncbi:helix-turn-helix domain-containing protein [Streptomyces phaeochromogenes]